LIIFSKGDASMSRVFNYTNNKFNQGIYFNNPVLTGPISMTSTGVISEAFAITALLLEGGAYTVTINGLLSATAANSYGLSLGYAATATPNQVSTITIGTTGEVYGTFYAITAYHAANITNNGALFGANGIYITGSSIAYTIANSGEINTGEGGYAIWTNDVANHTITNSGLITGHILGNSLAASNETITNSGTLNGEIRAFDGVDTVTNTGIIVGNIYLDGGNDFLTNNGLITGDINGWDGIDTIENVGTLNGYLLAGAGNDVLSNSGTINGGVDGWTGNDIFTNIGTVNGWIFLGEGNDRFIGGSTNENLADEAGYDNYAFGDGIDNFDAVGAGSNIGSDTVNGGLNSGINVANGIYGDEYNASDALTSVTINLDTVARIDSVSGLSYAASRSQGAETGTDTLRAFEVAYTGAGADVIFGNGAANYLSGAAGNDHLFGGSGNDGIAAGVGADTLAGDAGRDTLDGGVDSDIDTFLYKTLSDSTATSSGRDTILNFFETDRIDFSQMVLATGDINHYVGTNVAFDGLTGGVRALTTVTGWLIQVDTNGDTIADMAISVTDITHANMTDWSDNFLF
jgi:RTX calcium-binding nonapeptide repeat (4 copies)